MRTSTIVLITVTPVAAAIGALVWFAVQAREERSERVRQRTDAEREARSQDVRELQDGPALAITDRAFEADYRSNEIAADAKYRGKVLRLTGTIRTIQRGTDGWPEVRFRANGFDDVVCRYIDKDVTLGELHAGQTVTVRGRGGPRQFSGPSLIDCFVSSQ